MILLRFSDKSSKEQKSANLLHISGFHNFTVPAKSLLNLLEDSLIACNPDKS
jgi:hypothetical protein